MSLCSEVREKEALGGERLLVGELPPGRIRQTQPRSVVGRFGITNPLCVDVKLSRHFNDLVNKVVGDIHLHAMAHVEDPVHFLPVRLRPLLDGTE